MSLVLLPCSRGLSGQVRRRRRRGSCPTALLNWPIGAEELAPGSWSKSRPFPGPRGEPPWPPMARVSFPGGSAETAPVPGAECGAASLVAGAGVLPAVERGRDSGSAAKSRGRRVPLVRGRVDRGEAFERESFLTQPER